MRKQQQLWSKLFVKLLQQWDCLTVYHCIAWYCMVLHSVVQMRKQQQLWSKLFVIVTTMDLFEGCSYQSNRKSLFIEENLHKQVLIKGNCFLFQTHLINISFIKTLRLFFDFISTLDQLFIQRLTHTLVVYMWA